jgi:hypothetical protein
VLLLYTTCSGAEEKKWVIHEWGTFTSLQNEAGDAIGGINTDDEPVPPFVHRLAYNLLLQPTEIPTSFCQGVTRCHPDVTMRLETPVIYFHSPAAQTVVSRANVRVKFRGGWLTEYFPYAEPVAPGFRPAGHNYTNPASMVFEFGPLHSDTESKLEWNGLQIGGQWRVTNTTAHVWTSPRAVQSASVLTTNNETEKFLFYRGVAHIDAPLRVSLYRNSGELLFRSQPGDLPMNKPLTLRSLWLVDIRADGKIAFRTLPSVSLDHNTNKIVAHTPSRFESSDFSRGNLDSLKTALHTALVADGLFADEAEALLNTWELSYFKSAGLRVFFLVPRAWTDFYLPLETSLPADLNRVMVGRIELVTPEQREKLAEIRRFTPEKLEAEFGRMRTNFVALMGPNPEEFQRLYSGGKRLSADIPIPKTYQTYLDLGRFRNALVLDEARRRPTKGLTEFIQLYALTAHRSVENMPADWPAAQKLLQNQTP